MEKTLELEIEKVRGEIAATKKELKLEMAQVRKDLTIAIETSVRGLIR